MSGRIRSLKPEWLEDEHLAAASDEARVLSVGLILLADDYGNGRAHPLFIASRVWPYQEDPRESLAKVSRAFPELEAQPTGFIKTYKVKGQQYFHITNWTRHQRVDHPGKPVVPGPEQADPVMSREILANGSGGPRETLAPDLGPGPGPGEGEDPAREDPDHPVSKLRTRWITAYAEKTTLFWSFRTEKQNQLAVHLSEWIAKAGEASGLTYELALEKFIDDVFSSEKGAAKKYRFEFVASCPEEFWQSPNGSAGGGEPRYVRLSRAETERSIELEREQERRLSKARNAAGGASR